MIDSAAPIDRRKAEVVGRSARLELVSDSPGPVRTDNEALELVATTG